VTSSNSLDVMTLECEVMDGTPALGEAVAENLKAVTGLNGAVHLVAPGTLANDGKVIDDQREIG